MRSTLEAYKGPGSRHPCPACGEKKRFTRYIDIETGRYLADNVGRCDRESSCGYHFKPREYFAGIGDRENLIKPQIRRLQKPGISRKGRKRETFSQANYSQRIKARKPNFIDKRHLIESLGSYDQNGFVRFLFELFPFDPEAVTAAVNEYWIGTGPCGEAIFWQIDAKHRIRTGKLIAYDQQTGKRRQDRSPNWIHAGLKKTGQLPDTFELRQCFFGEHLLPKYPGRAIAIVEAEKSALVASLCDGVLPDLVWLACGGKSNLNVDKLERLGRDRRILLYPDADGFEKWQAVGCDSSKRGLNVKVSDLIERRATDAEKASGFDVADYLIREQSKRNDPARREAFRDLIEERLAIMTVDGGITEAEAEATIIRSTFYQDAIRTVVRE